MKKILLVIVLIIIVVIIGLGVAAKYYAPKIVDNFIKNDKAALVQTVDQFLFNIRDGKPAEAYEMTAYKMVGPGTITVESLGDEEFKVDLKNFTGQDAELYKYKVTKFLGGKYRVEYLAVTNFSDGKKGQLGIVALKDKKTGVWKIQGFHWATLPDKIW